MMYLLYGNPILIAAAVIPAIFLLVQINKADKLDREPVGLLVSLVIQGIISTALAVLTERLGTAILDSLWPENALVYRVLMYFVVVGLSEEGFKYLLLKRRTWYSPDFNCQFDGVVYAVCVALGFALWENIDYVIMYGLARRYANYGYERASKNCRRLAVLVPMVLHGIYDFIASSEDASEWVFLIFVAALFLVTSRMVKRLSQTDRYID